ncbi:MAG: acyl--CoA ligase, partial [Xanthobacteraceae bacterium]|nr:acyl--CoA ligase [Xanthobacteraceae bacterium]
MDLVQAIQFHGYWQPDAPALYFPDHQESAMNYGELVRCVANVNRRLLGQGIEPGSLVAINVVDDLLHAVLLIACARMGVATVSGEPVLISSQLAVSASLRDKAVSDTGLPFVLVGRDWLARSVEVADTLDLPWPRHLDLCRVMLTSGSTATPKPVVLTYGMVAERLRSYNYAFGGDFPKASRLLCGMRLSSSLGFTFLFYILQRGGFYCSDSREMSRMESAIKGHEIEAIVTTPYTLAEFVKHARNQPLQFAKLKLGLTAGSLITSSLVRQVREALCDKLVVFYGATETGVIASTSREGVAGDVGLPVPGTRVKIISPEGASLVPGQSGLIRIQAVSGPLPFFTASQWKEKKPPNDWYEPGDMGKFDDRGHLLVEGRADNLLNVGGTKVAPEVLEQSLAKGPGIRDCAVYSERDEEGIDRIVAVIAVDSSWKSQPFLTYCEAHIAADLLPSKFVAVANIPRTPNDKIARGA